MFEVKEEDILNRMLESIPKNIDKRKDSSLIYNALAPAAQEVAKIRSDMDRFLSYSFASKDMPEEYLDLKAMEYGLTRKPATYAVKLGIFTDADGNLMDIPLNSRFSIDKINYEAIEKIDKGKYKMKCETLGAVGNYPTGTLLPIEYVEGLGTAKLNESLESGIEVEDNEKLFNRLMLKIKTPATSGNKYHYLNWALAVDGVGAAKVFPLADGPGTVKVVIADSDKKAASSELVEKTDTYIEELRPIGANVTVVSAIEKPINITADVSIIKGVNLANVQAEFSNLLTEYLKSIAFDTEYISIAKIGNILLSTAGVIDYKNLKVNGELANIALDNEDIAVLGTVNLGVI
ncbi:baseplate J/gp47 family protein [Clostridium sp. YIM B02555]|uniref:baseplate J/gp47 family protein n=1 Tax=Clostridium sp. YIM B02555 TaxID=2911968 RepID=UPI001EEDBA65|nr:baseplate J/gp47 family protein [Clostridium sp. YIM B02555]